VTTIGSEVVRALITLALGTQEPILLPGFADLQLLPGAVMSEDCVQILPELPEGRMACLRTIPLRINALARDYGAEATEKGWRWGSGAGSAIWYERDRTDGQCDRLTLLAFWDFEKYAETELPSYAPMYLAIFGSTEDCVQASQ